MKYYVMYRRKNHNKFVRYNLSSNNLSSNNLINKFIQCNLSSNNLSSNNLINIKLDIETIYRWQDVGDLLDDVVEWRIYDEKDNLCEIGVVESNVKGKEVSWFVEV